MFKLRVWLVRERPAVTTKRGAASSLAELNVAAIFLDHHLLDTFVSALRAGTGTPTAIGGFQLIQRGNGGLQLVLVDFELDLLLCQALQQICVLLVQNRVLLLLQTMDKAEKSTEKMIRKIS
jgi:hypothetical protein